MQWSHLLQIDETYPVKIYIVNRNNFWSQGQYGEGNLFPFPYKHPLSVHPPGSRTLRTGVSLRETASQTA